MTHELVLASLLLFSCEFIIDAESEEKLSFLLWILSMANYDIKVILLACR